MPEKYWFSLAYEQVGKPYIFTFNPKTGKSTDARWQKLLEDADDEPDAPLTKQIATVAKEVKTTETAYARAQEDAAKPPAASANDPKGTKVQKRETLGDGKTYSVTYVA